MTKLPADLEALMPEPVIVGTSRFGTIFYAHPDIVMREFGRAVWEAATERAAKLDGAEIAAYALPAPGAGPIDQIRIERVRQMDGGALWAVRFRGEVLNKDGVWEWEPMPSSRDDSFLARARFGSAEEAIAAIRAASMREGGGS